MCIVSRCMLKEKSNLESITLCIVLRNAVVLWIEGKKL